MPELKNRVRELRMVRGGDIESHGRNFRNHPAKQIAAIQGTLQSVGIADALLAFPADGLGPAGDFSRLCAFDGHARKDLDPDQVWPVLVCDLTRAEADAMLATLDWTSSLAEIDGSMLAELIQDAGEVLPADLMASLDALARDNAALVPVVIVEDEVPEVQAAPVCRVGDLWSLGRHRVLCGDSTKPEDVARLMGGRKADLCFTSPPYGDQRDYDKERGQAWDALMSGVFGNLPMSDSGQVLVNLGLIHRDGEWLPYWNNWLEWMKASGWRRFGWYVWDQGAGLPGDWNGRLAPSHEFVWHFNREAVKPYKAVACDPKTVAIGKRATAKRKAGGIVTSMRAADGVVKPVSSTERNQFKIAESMIRVNRNVPNLSPQEMVEVFRLMLRAMPTGDEKELLQGVEPQLSEAILTSWTAADSVIRVNRQCGSIGHGLDHPAVFPVRFPAFVLQCWKGLVYEPFGGSGTTLIAAEQLGRECCCMEISPAYCDVICRRFEAITGQKAALITG